MTHTAARVQSSRALLGDRILLTAIGLSALVSLVLGLQFVESGLAIGVTLALLALTSMVYLSNAATLLSRYTLTFVLLAFFCWCIRTGS